jgi:hypothetical protein
VSEKRQMTDGELYVQDQMALDPETQEGNWTLGHLETFAASLCAQLQSEREAAGRIRAAQAQAERERDRMLERVRTFARENCTCGGTYCDVCWLVKAIEDAAPADQPEGGEKGGGE